MTRWVLAALALGACKGTTRDPSLAELRAPTRAVLRAHEEDAPAECTETGIKRLGCWFKTERRGCLYLEVGATADGDEGPKADRAGELCAQLSSEAGRLVLLQYQGHHDTAELASDEAGERLAWRAGTGNWEVVYLLDGELFGTAEPDYARARALANALGGGVPQAPSGLGGLGLRGGGLDTGDSADPGAAVAAVDWKRTPTLEEATPRLLDALDTDRQGRLIAAVRARAGDEGLLRLLKDTTPAIAWWQTVFDQLDEEGQRQAVDQLRTLVETNEAAASEQAVLDWFTAHPGQEPANYGELLVRHVEGAAGVYDEEGNVSAFLDELVRRSHPRAGELACQLLGARLADELVQGQAEGPVGLNPTALHALAVQKTPCPWVEIALTRNACAVDLRCSPSGLPEASDEYYALPVTGRPQNALCPMATVQRRLGKWPRDDSITPMPGLELLAAGYARGPLPREVLVRNARRLYRVVGLPPPRPEDDTEELSADSACEVLPSSPEELACALPTSTTEVTMSGCRLRIDDELQTLRLDDVRARKTPLEPGAYDRGHPFYREGFHHD